MLKWITLQKSKYVAPRAGAWIETTRNIVMQEKEMGRPPRGGVD